VFSADGSGLLSGPEVHPSSGATPYGFDFTGDGTLVVTEAFGGEVGAAAASSYGLAGGALSVVSPSVQNTRSEVCWAVVSKDSRFAYVTNFGDGTISSYRIGGNGSIELLDPVAASTVLGEKGVRDEGITSDGRFLYALDADARRVFGWAVGEDGSLEPVGSADGLPATAAGLAAA
jgi:6-phosphogluconolactonase